MCACFRCARTPTLECSRTSSMQADPSPAFPCARPTGVCPSFGMTTMKRPLSLPRPTRLLVSALSLCVAGWTGSMHAQEPSPQLLDPNLAVRTAVSGLTTPIGLAFLGTNDWLVIEKDTGQVKRVVDGNVAGTVLDLAVNFASERGLLGIALHPQFASNHFVYLFWSCR